MKTPTSPRIVGADKVDGDVILTFDDGMCALFPASFLYANLAQARRIEDLQDGDEDDPGIKGKE